MERAKNDTLLAGCGCLPLEVLLTKVGVIIEDLLVVFLLLALLEVCTVGNY